MSWSRYFFDCSIHNPVAHTSSKSIRWHHLEPWSQDSPIYVAVNRLKPKQPLCVWCALHRDLELVWATGSFGFCLDTYNKT